MAEVSSIHHSRDATHPPTSSYATTNELVADPGRAIAVGERGRGGERVAAPARARSATSSRSTKIAPGRWPASYFRRPSPGLAEDPADVDDPEIRVGQAGGKILGRDQGHAGSVAHRASVGWPVRGLRAILSAGATPRRRAPDRLPVPPLRRSSVVERAAVNRLVVGSSPTAGATLPASHRASELKRLRPRCGCSIPAVEPGSICRCVQWDQRGAADQDFGCHSIPIDPSRSTHRVQLHHQAPAGQPGLGVGRHRHDGRGSRAARLAASCTATGFVRDGIDLTAAQIGGTVTGALDATGCDIGAYNPTSVSERRHPRRALLRRRRQRPTVNTTNSKVHQIGENPFDGTQHGRAILYINGASGTISGNKVYAFQKNGIEVSGLTADASGPSSGKTSATVSNNVVTGGGHIDDIAQNGIVIRSGANATVKNNTVSHLCYTPDGTEATGLLNYDAGKVRCRATSSSTPRCASTAR